MSIAATDVRAPDEHAAPPELSARGRAILDVAVDVFLELGFENASVDEVVRRASGSKATVYKMFGNKEGLFAAVVDDVVGEIELPIPDDDADIESTLVDVAAEHISVVFSERHVRLMRMVAAEAIRFPNLGASYHAHGPALGHAKVASYLRRQADRGTICCDDPVGAAQDFWGMVLHRDTLRRLYAVVEPPSGDDSRRRAEQIVARFLRIYPLS